MREGSTVLSSLVEGAERCSTEGALVVDETTLAGGSTIGGITVGSKGVESGGKGGVKSGGRGTEDVFVALVDGLGYRWVIGDRRGSLQRFGVVRRGISECGCRHCTAQKNVGG